MSKTAIVFPGQGSQYTCMGEELCKNFSSSKKIFEIGSNIFGFDFLETVISSNEAELSETTLSQPLVYAVSLAALMAARENNIEYDGVAGHSLGEYAAMVASGFLSVEDGFKAVKLRSIAINDAAQKNKGEMAAVLGNCADLIEETCSEISLSGDYVEPVNYNSTAQIVIAGSSEGIKKAIETLTEKGVKKIIKLKVSAAFHSKYMVEAGGVFKTAIRDFKFKTPDKLFYSNVSGGLLQDFSDMPSYLAKHICSPVKFSDELISMEKDGFNKFIEMGPGKTLSGFVRKTLSNVIVSNIENIKSLEETKKLCVSQNTDS